MLLEVAALLLLQLLCVLLRALYILAKPRPLLSAGPVKTMIVLGSGVWGSIGDPDLVACFSMSEIKTKFKLMQEDTPPRC
jgi:hypothetical protein